MGDDWSRRVLGGEAGAKWLCFHSDGCPSLFVGSHCQPTGEAQYVVAAEMIPFRSEKSGNARPRRPRGWSGLGQGRKNEESRIAGTAVSRLVSVPSLMCRQWHGVRLLRWMRPSQVETSRPPSPCPFPLPLPFANMPKLDGAVRKAQMDDGCTLHTGCGRGQAPSALSLASHCCPFAVVIFSASSTLRLVMMLEIGVE